FYSGVRPEYEAPLLHGIGPPVERELECSHSLAPERDVSEPLTTIANFFASRVGDDAAGTAIDAARRRAELVAGSQRPSSTAVVSFAGEAFDICALDCGWGAAEAAELVRELVVVLAEPAAATGAALFLAASRKPHPLHLPPPCAVH